MSTKNPIPPFSGQLRTWADKIVGYLRTLESEIDTPGPKVVQLEHKQPTASAAVDGLLMFDPVLGKVVYSQGGSWHALP
jgi:hypothetical protein